ncbi:MAG TPA: hypothetical protein V6D50_12355 [Chroococcales cyanobacterium]|jgi:hypothetical protein
MPAIETHSYKNWQIEIYQKEPGIFGYQCCGLTGERSRNEGYAKTQDTVQSAQNYTDEQPDVSGLDPIKEVGSPLEDDISSGEELNDL